MQSLVGLLTEKKAGLKKLPLGNWIDNMETFRVVPMLEVGSGNRSRK